MNFFMCSGNFNIANNSKNFTQKTLKWMTISGENFSKPHKVFYYSPLSLWFIICNTAIYSSSDGEIFSLYTQYSSLNTSSFASYPYTFENFCYFSNSKFISSKEIVGGNKPVYSSDMKTWNDGNIPSYDLSGLLFRWTTCFSSGISGECILIPTRPSNVNGSWFGTSSSERFFPVAKTTDYGVNWTITYNALPAFSDPSTTTPSNSNWGSSPICFAKGKYVLIANYYQRNNTTTGDCQAAAYSLNGTTWTSNQFALPNSDRWFSNLVFGNNIFVCLGSVYSFVSSDGINWNSYNQSGKNVLATGCALGFGNNIFVANIKNYISYSSDGILWTTISFPLQLRSGLTIGYYDKNFVIACDFGHNYTFKIVSNSLIANFDANLNVSFDSSTNYVSKWMDTYSGITASQSNLSYQPLITQNYINNNKPAIVFNSVNRNMILTTTTLTTTTNFTMFFVIIPKTFAGGGYNQFLGTTGVWQTGCVHLFINTSSLQISVNVNGNNDWNPSCLISVDVPLILVINITSVGGCVGSYRINGVSGSTTNIFSTSSINMLTQFDVGGWGQSGRSFQGGIGQFIYYDRTLNLSEIKQNEVYLSSKWSIIII